MTLSKSTRAELRRRCPTPEETDALLDMADERDRYRALLVEARAAIDVVGWALQSDIDKTRERIDAALEGEE